MANEMVHYCPICGMEAKNPEFNRFGEWACSAAHAEEYVKKVRRQQMQTVADSGEGRRRRGC